MTASTVRTIRKPRSYETTAWRWMRYSAFLLIPLAWGHVLLQDVIVGVHAMDLNYVAYRWANIGWRIYDVLLLDFAFAHGVNGFRQVLYDYIAKPKTRRIIDWALLIFWFVVTLIGAVAIVGGVRME